MIAQAKPKPAPINVTPGASAHRRAGQTLTQSPGPTNCVALIDVNAISDPNKVTVGTSHLRSPVKRPRQSPNRRKTSTPTHQRDTSRINFKPKFSRNPTVAAKGPTGGPTAHCRWIGPTGSQGAAKWCQA